MKNYHRCVLDNLNKICSWKIYKIMRNTILILFLGIFQAYASDSYSQNTRLSLELDDVTLGSVLEEIENNSDFFFLYNAKLIDINREVTISAENEKISDILSSLFSDTGVKYMVYDRQIVLSAVELKIPTESKPESEYQQIIRGIVTDEKGNPLPGVSVVVKGTTLGTLTDISGSYNLTNISPDATLVFSFIGMSTQEIQVTDKTQINVVLKEEAIGLDEVVVIGYGTQKKNDLTGSVVRINMEGKELAANVTLGQALQGNNPGINVSGGGLAGAEMDISIRGRTSLSATDNPLIVLDGIIYNGSISDINVNDVESIDILKDASAAAVFGSRSANGVMIITTKKGKSDKPLFNFNTYYGFQDIINNPMKVMNADQYAIRLVDFYYQQDLYSWYATHPVSNEGKPIRPDITDRNLVAQRLRSQEEKDNYLAGNEIDWIKEITRISPIQNYDLGISGKTDRTNYYLSGSYTDQKGVLLNDQFKRVTLLSNYENKLTDWFTLGLSSSYSYRDYSGIEASMASARYSSPLANMYTSTGDYAVYLTGENYMPHPLGNLLIDNKDLRNNLFVVAKAKITIPKIKGLIYDFNYSNTFNTRKMNSFYPVNTSSGAGNKGLAIQNPSEERSWILNNIVTFSRTFINDHIINATLLYSREQRMGSSLDARAQGFNNPVLGYNNMGLGTITTIGSGAWEENSISFMSRLGYTFKNRYLLTGTVRKDGFSGFGANKKYSTFPSLSIGWVISDEVFLKNVNWINFLKLRASYGKNGNQGIGRYSSFSKMTNTAYVLGNQTFVGVSPNSLGNDDLGWESTASFNLGIDYGVLNSRISGSIEAYKAETTNVLVTRTLPGATGYSNVWANIGEISNKGIEIGLTTININSLLRWETKFVFSLNRDEIKKLYGSDNDRDLGNSWFVGEPISTIYDYQASGGVWTEEELYTGQISVANYYPGHFRYVDLNNDGRINPNDDRTIIGYKAPNYRFSINSSLSYKDFTFFFLINSIQGGNDYYLGNNTRAVIAAASQYPNLTTDYTYRRNTSAVRQYWTPDNGVNNSPGIFYSTPFQAAVYEDRSFVRLQDISLIYNLKNSMLENLKLADLQLYVSGKNLYTWTKWSGWDPEIGDETTLMMRSIIAGVKISF